MWMLLFRSDLAGDPFEFWALAGPGNAAQTTAGGKLNQWHHVVGIEAASNDRRIYLDGGNKGTNATSRIPSTPNRTSIGRLGDATPSEWWSGLIGPVAIWNVVLSELEVRRLARGTPAHLVRGGNLVGYWPLPPIKGGARDYSGKNLHLSDGNTVEVSNLLPPLNPFFGQLTLYLPFEPSGAAIKTGRLSAIEALLTYTEKRSRLSAVETLATYTEKRSRLSAAEVLVTFAEKRARLTAVESLLTYSEKRALLSAVEALATYSEKHARLSALEALLTYSEKHARVTALETLATYTEKRAQLSAIETLTTYSLKRARLSAAETLVTYSEKRALLSAIEVLVDYLATGGAPGGETARLTAIEVLITFTARQLAQQYPMDATIRTRVGHLLRPQVFVHPTRRKPT